MRIALIVGAVLAAVALAYWFVHYRTYGRFQQSSNDAYLSADQVNVSSRIAGYVEPVLVSDNQVVREGQPLVRIDRRTSDTTADQARAQIAQGEASVAQARAKRRQQLDAIAQARAQADGSHGGAIVNLGSIGSEIASPMMGAYAASKAALEKFTHTLQEELIGERVPIAVTLVRPSGVGTSLAEHAAVHMEGDARLPHPFYDLSVVAEAILDALQRDRGDVIVGGTGHLLVFLPRVLPGCTAGLPLRSGEIWRTVRSGPTARTAFTSPSAAPASGRQSHRRSNPAWQPLLVGTPGWLEPWWSPLRRLRSDRISQNERPSLHPAMRILATGAESGYPDGTLSGTDADPLRSFHQCCASLEP